MQTLSCEEVEHQRDLIYDLIGSCFAFSNDQVDQAREIKAAIDSIKDAKEALRRSRNENDLAAASLVTKFRAAKLVKARLLDLNLNYDLRKNLLRHIDVVVLPNIKRLKPDNEIFNMYVNLGNAYKTLRLRLFRNKLVTDYEADRVRNLTLTLLEAAIAMEALVILMRDRDDMPRMVRARLENARVNYGDHPNMGVF